MTLGRLKILKSAPFLNETAATWDDDLKNLLTVAGDIAQAYTARDLELKTYDEEIYTGDGTKRLWLFNQPVRNIIEVRLWDGDDSFDVESTDYYKLINEKYLFYPTLGQEANATWENWSSKYEGGIKVSYIAGYDTQGWDDLETDMEFGVPYDLEYAVCAIAQVLWQEGKKGGARRGLSTISVISESVTVEKFIAGIPTDAKMILDKYRRLAA